MQDIYQVLGSDIQASVSGDLQPVSTYTRSQQRLLRRLLTPAGSYIWHVNYGAGLQQYVGMPLSTSLYQKIVGIINFQIQQEISIAKSPAPVISIKSISEGLYCNIQFTESSTQTTQYLTFTVSK